MEEKRSDLVESYVLNLINFCNEFLNQQKEHSENFPDDPLIDYDEFIENGVQTNELDKLKGDNVTFSCADGLAYTTWIPKPYLDDFRIARAFPINKNGNLIAKSINVWKGERFSGMAIAGNDRWFNINPEAVWGSIWGYVWKNALPNGLNLTGEEAYRFWSANFELYKAFEAASFSLEIERNPNLLPYIKKFKPYLLDHPAIQIELAKAYKRDFIQELPIKKGRPQELTKEILEMYFWVYFYRYQGLTLNEACLQTISQHSRLVPNDWRDTDATLKQTVTRLDKLTSISQKKGFIEFKKMKKDIM